MQKGVTVLSLDKAIKSGKEHRKPYRKAKAVCTSCRNHGNCDWCLGNRTYSARKRETAWKQELLESECMEKNDE